MIPEEVQGPHTWLSVPSCRPKVLLGISLEGFELESADAEEADCKPTRNTHFHIDSTNSLIFFNVVFYIHWNKNIHSFKNKDWNHCSFWRSDSVTVGKCQVWGAAPPGLTTWGICLHCSALVRLTSWEKSQASWLLHRGVLVGSAYQRETVLACSWAGAPLRVITHKSSLSFAFVKKNRVIWNWEEKLFYF